MTLVLIALITLAAATAALAGKRSDVARKLNRGLASTPMAGTGYLLEQAGHRYRVHPALIAAIAGTESSFGAVPCSNNRRNAFGLSSCGAGWHVPYFETWREAYHFMGRFLSSRWPHARSPWHFYGYAACDSCWGNRVAFFMGRLGFSPEVRYP